MKREGIEVGIKTHTFNGTKYDIEFADSIEGITDVPSEDDGKLEMLILTGDDLRAFHSAFHEALEASRFCDKCLHHSDGTYRTWDAARFLWRWVKENLPQ